MTGERLYHGGVAGLVPGDRIVPTPGGRHVDGCPICEARANGDNATIHGEALDPPTGRSDRVYLTTDRLLARHYAALAGGDLYSVTAEELEPSEEDPIISAVTAPEAVVATVVERAVRLSDGERRRLWRRMGGTSYQWRQMRSDIAQAMHP